MKPGIEGLNPLDITNFYLFEGMGRNSRLKIAGKGASLETLRQVMSVRFDHGDKAKTQATQPVG